MTAYDLAVRGGQVVTGNGLDPTRCDTCIRRGRIAAMPDSITDAAETVDAGGLLAEPGSGRVLPRLPYPFIAPTGTLPDGLDAAAPYAAR